MECLAGTSSGSQGVRTSTHLYLSIYCRELHQKLVRPPPLQAAQLSSPSSHTQTDTEADADTHEHVIQLRSGNFRAIIIVTRSLSA